MNNRALVLNNIGIFCLAFSIILLPPIMVSTWYHDGELESLFDTFLILIMTGSFLWLFFKEQTSRLQRRDGFLIVASFWIVLSFIGALPLLLGPGHLSAVDSIFETTSGITTTGATIITDLNNIPPSILFYRQELQWIGGMGLVVLAIAVLPMLGIGGMTLYRAETPGPMKDEKLTPRLANTARNLLSIYIILTLSCAIAYWLAAVPPLDALEHSFSTVSTGGFSTHNESFAFFHSRTVNLIAVVFMIAGGINFSVHFLALRKQNPLFYLYDIEVRSFFFIIITFVTFFTFFLTYTNIYPNIYNAFQYSLFEITSVITSTGFGITDFTAWPLCMPLLLIIISFIGGCGGSTAGGMKVIRILTLLKQGAHELFMLLHPRAVHSVKIGQRILDEKTTQAIWGFFSVYVIVFMILTLSMMMAGLDQVSAFSAVATCINNLGPGLGKVSMTFANISDTAKLIAIIAMLLGRLEIFTLLVILTPEFWRN